MLQHESPQSSLAQVGKPVNVAWGGSALIPVGQSLSLRRISIVRLGDGDAASPVLGRKNIDTLNKIQTRIYIFMPNAAASTRDGASIKKLC